MKKLPTYILPIVVALVVWGAFLVPYASAVTVYQQFSDSSGIINVDGEHQIIGSFTVSQNINYVDAEIQLLLENKSGVCTGSQIVAFTATSSALTSGNDDGSTRLADFRPGLSPNGTGSVCIPDDDSVHFALGTTSVVAGSTNTTFYQPGIVYYIYFVVPSSSGDGFDVYTNLSGDFYYGYLTAGGFPLSGVIHPGLPGYTDVGISTTSQQAYCNSNFSTSTGLLDSVGQSISLGICNVSVFLFVPSNTAVSQFQSLASTTQAKIPFSYFFDIRNVFTAFSASSTTNLPTYSIGLSTLGIGSTSPLGNVLPNLTVLSTSTVDTYMPSGMRTTLLNVISFGIWTIAGLSIYRRIVPHKAHI